MKVRVLVAPSMEYVMFGKPTLASSLKQLGDQLLDNEALKAVMISKDDAGDIIITLVEGIEESTRSSLAASIGGHAPLYLTLPGMSAEVGRLATSLAHNDPTTDAQYLTAAAALPQIGLTAFALAHSGAGSARPSDEAAARV